MQLALDALHWDGKPRGTSPGTFKIDLLFAGLEKSVPFPPPSPVDSEWQSSLLKAFRATLNPGPDSTSKVVIPAVPNVRKQGQWRMSGRVPLEASQLNPVPASNQGVIQTDLAAMESASQESPFSAGPHFDPSLSFSGSLRKGKWEEKQISHNPKDSRLNLLGNPEPLFSLAPVRLGALEHSCPSWIPAPARAIGIDVEMVRLPAPVFRLNAARLFSKQQAIPDRSVMEFIPPAGLGKMERQSKAGSRNPVVIGGAIRQEPAKSCQQLPRRVIQLGQLGHSKPGIFIPRVGMATLRPRIAFASGATPSNRPAVDSKGEQGYRGGRPGKLALAGLR